VEAFMAAAVADYRRKSETYLVAGHAAIVGPPAIPAYVGLVDQATNAGASPDLVTALNDVAATLVAAGASVSFVVMAADVFASFIALTSDEVQWWLKDFASVSLTGQATTVAGITIATSPDLPAGTILGGDSEAVDFRETGPIRVTAVNLPNGGIDLGLFGYFGHVLHDNAGLVKATVATTPLAAKAKGK
jgi:hypothetical protein